MYQVKTSEEMQALGRALADTLRDGDVVLLTGEMGAGKSELSRGVARGLGIKGPVPSPTFTILNLYEEGRMPLYHFDWYRIEDEEELFASGLDEMIGLKGLTLIEWHEKAPDLRPASGLEIIIQKQDDLSRTVQMKPFGGFHAIDLSKWGNEVGQC